MESRKRLFRNLSNVSWKNPIKEILIKLKTSRKISWNKKGTRIARRKNR